MKKTLLLLLFIVASCSGADTPEDISSDNNHNNGGGNGNTGGGKVIENYSQLDYLQFPNKLEFKQTSLFVNNNTLRGVLPYPIVNLKSENFVQEYDFIVLGLDPEETSLKIYNNIESGVMIHNNEEAIYETISHINLFNGQEANINHNKLNYSTSNNFCFTYKLNSNPEEDQNFSVYYQQTGASTWEKIGYKSKIVETIVGQLGKTC